MDVHSKAVQRWLKVTPAGLYCEAGGFYIDPARAVDRAVITHGHGDHARPGHRHVLATEETLAIMRARYDGDAGRSSQGLAYGEVVQVGDVALHLSPAGHVLGSAQIVLEHKGQRVVVSGDYKRRRDPTCPSFTPIACDIFISEATFGLPVFRHPPDRGEIDKLLTSLKLFPERCQLVGVYALGKAQRVIMLLREAGHTAPLYIHGALAKLCDLYRDFGLDLGTMLPATEAKKSDLRGQIVLAPPGAANQSWARRLPDPVVAMASGWMGVRARARQRGAELPLVISDHADWDELTQTFADVQAPTIWITHGREEALVHHARKAGRNAWALSVAGREDEDE